MKKTTCQLLPFLLLTTTILLAGCAGTGNSVKPPLDQGYSLQINQSFKSLPNYTRLYFQGGNQVIQGNLDKWSTYCRLHVFNQEQQADYMASVMPGSFNIESVKNRRESSRSVPASVSTGTSGAWSAGLLKTSFGISGGVFDPPSYYLYRVVLNLGSDNQPDVQSLTCSKKWATRGDYYPTLQEIRAALGNAIELKPAS